MANLQVRSTDKRGGRTDLPLAQDLIRCLTSLTVDLISIDNIDKGRTPVPKEGTATIAVQILTEIVAQEDIIVAH